MSSPSLSFRRRTSHILNPEYAIPKLLVDTRISLVAVKYLTSNMRFGRKEPFLYIKRDYVCIYVAPEKCSRSTKGPELCRGPFLWEVFPNSINGLRNFKSTTMPQKLLRLNTPPGQKHSV